MFSQEERCRYEHPQVMDVICQLRFPTILAIGAREPVDFQEEIRAVFPNYLLRQDRLPAKVTAVPGQPPKVEQQKPIANHQFATQDGKYRINLSQNFISLTCSAYTCWEDFAAMLDKPLASFIKIYQPAFFERVGLRYLNAISRRDLGLEHLSWKELIEPAYLGLLSSEDVPEQAFTQCSQQVEMALPHGCRLKLHAGPGLVKRGQDTSDKEVKMILDLDVSMGGNVPVNAAAASMQTIHDHAGRIFRGAITDTLHEAMGAEG
ncbi:MAG: TIGR04255 family protein [Oscillospiraceae bacterium]|nr:TIGR04255 family protein [Oscillospiraceae bacterium]